ncbi:MAG TPA: HAMP domain-containing protein [Candidatus Ozemobacteraceae bacterium]|nr:HAMP domain-containing protein [Candidatus Ozemobacteraceae bacterium]
MKSSRWLTAFWLLVLILPLLVFAIERGERFSQAHAAARAAARVRARDLMLEAQSLALPRDSIAHLLRSFQQQAERIARNTRDASEARRRIHRAYRNGPGRWLPAHALLWRPRPALDLERGLRMEMSAGRRFPENAADLFVDFRWAGKIDESRLERLLASMIDCPATLDYQDGNKNGKLQTFVSRSGIHGLYWRVPFQSGLIAWLDLTGLDPHLGMRYAAARFREAGCGLMFTDERGVPVVAGGDGKRQGRQLAARLLALGNGSFPAVARVAGRLAMTGPLPSGTPGRVIVTVPWPPEPNIRKDSGTAVPLAAAAVLGALLLGLAHLATRRATVGWMLLGACLGLAIVPAGAAWVLVRRAVTEYGQVELRTTVNKLHDDLTGFDNGGMRLHASIVSGLVRIARKPETYRLLESRPTSRMRSALRPILGASALTGPYLREASPELLIGVAPDDQIGLISYKRMDEETMPAEDRPILEVFGSLARKVRDGITRIGKKTKEAAVPQDSEASKIRESMRADILFDIFQGIIGIDAMIAQVTFPEDLLEVKTSFIRVFLMEMRVFREGKFPTEWLLSWMWDDSRELSHVDRVFRERFGSHSGSDPISERPFAADTPDAPPEAPEIWIVGGMAELMFREWVAPAVPTPRTLMRAVERARNTGVLQTGRDLSAPGRPVFEAFPGSSLSRFVIAGQVETNSIERRAARFQLGGNILAVSLVTIALALAWYARGRLLKPLERLRLSMMEVAAGNFDVRIPLDRSDEFGTLAAAFNSMARALQEAAILGRFVSGSVRRAVRDRRTDESGRGERREVTVLFSCLLHFEQFCQGKSPDQVFAALGSHLGALNAELAAYPGGAEIDKVIGDKILVVFDHERMGGAKATAEAVLAIVRGVRHRLAQAGLEAAMGINTGLVISGILGATSVRLDHTVIGDPVNLASRLALLAHMTEGTRTVVSGAFLAACATPPAAEKLPFRKVKGKTQEVEAYLLRDPSV